MGAAGILDCLVCEEEVLGEVGCGGAVLCLGVAGCGGAEVFEEEDDAVDCSVWQNGAVLAAEAGTVLYERLSGCNLP